MPLSRSTWLLLLLVVGPLFGQSPVPRRALVHGNDSWITGPTLQNVPVWNGTLLLGCDPCQSKEPILFMIDRQSRRDELVFGLPEAGYVSVSGMGSAVDG